MSLASGILVVGALGGKFGIIGDGDLEILSKFISNLFQMTIKEPDQRYTLKTERTIQACMDPLSPQRGAGASK
jgi:hypothetical protein